MVSDYRRPRPRATPEELQMRCQPLRWVGRRGPALPDVKRSGIKPLFHAGFKCRAGVVMIRSSLPMYVAIAADVTTTRTLVTSYDTTSTRMILF